MAFRLFKAAPILWEEAACCAVLIANLQTDVKAPRQVQREAFYCNLKRLMDSSFFPMLEKTSKYLLQKTLCKE